MTTAPLLGPSHLGGMASPVVPGGRHVTRVIESTLNTVALGSGIWIYTAGKRTSHSATM